MGYMKYIAFDTLLGYTSKRLATNWPSQSHIARTPMKFRSALRAACTVFFVVLVFAIRVFADDVPTFRNPYVNTFVKSWSQFVHDYVEAMKADDWSKAQAIESRIPELQTELEKLSGKVKPDEEPKFKLYIMQCQDKIWSEQETCLKKALEKP